jgi:hypothetical protein
MLQSVHVGEIHVPGSSALYGAKTFILTRPTEAGQKDVELFFGFFAAEAHKKLIEKLCDRLTEEVRPVFFGDPAASSDERYEAAVKRMNSVILGFLHEHGVSLSGIKLRGAACALVGEKLMISGRGSVRCHLAVPHGAKNILYDLFDGAEGNQQSPKFFSAMQTGTLPPGSRIHLATSELFSTLDDAFTKRALVMVDGAAMTREIKNALKTSRQPSSFVSIELPGRPEVVAIVSRQEQGVKSQVSAARREPAMPPVVGPDIGAFAAGAIKSGFVLGIRGARHTPKLFSWLWGRLVGAVKLLRDLGWAVLGLFRRERRSSVIGGLAEWHDRVIHGAIDRMNDMSAASRAKSLTMLFLGVLVMHGAFFVAKHQLRVSEVKAYEAKLTEFESLRTDVETSLIYGNDARSNELFNRLKIIVASMPEDTLGRQKAKAEAASVMADVQNRLRRIVTIDAPDTFALFVDGGGDYADGSLVRLGDSFFLLSRVRPAGIEISATGTVTFRSIGGSLTSGVVDAAPAASGLLLLDTEGAVHYWNPEGDAAVRYPDVLLASGDPILFYQGRLYNRTPDNAIVRRSIMSRKLGAPAAVTPPPDGMATVTGLAADGALYLVSKEGKMRKFMHGAAVAEFVPPVIDPPPTDAAELWADAGSPWLIFIDKGGNRLFVVDKSTGRLAGQLTSPAFDSLDGLALDERGGYAYLLDGNRVWTIPLPTSKAP